MRCVLVIAASLLAASVSPGQATGWPPLPVPKPMSRPVHKPVRAASLPLDLTLPITVVPEAGPPAQVNVAYHALAAPDPWEGFGPDDGPMTYLDFEEEKKVADNRRVPVVGVGAVGSLLEGETIPLFRYTIKSPP